MDVLISLANVIKRQKIYQAELIDELDKHENKMSFLYNLILEDKVKNDFDAIKYLYSGKEKYSNLEKVKSRLYSRLINSVFFLDVSSSSYSDYFEAAKTCYKNYAAIKLLHGNYHYLPSIDLAKKTLKQSIRYDFTDLNYLLSSLLRNNFFDNSKKFKKYNSLKKYYFNALDSENEVELIYSQLVRKLSKSSSSLSKEDIKYFLEKEKYILKLNESLDTYRLNYFSTVYQIALSLELKNYKNIITVADIGLKKYFEKGIKASSTEYIFNARKALASFLLGKYEIAENIYLNNLNLLKEGSINWFSNYNHFFSLKIVQKKYLDAYIILCKVFENKFFDKTHPLLIQLWKIKEAYIHFLIDLGKINPEESSEPPLRKFRLSRFLNDVPTYSKDKRGVNISILIIQMILLVQNKKYDQVLDRLDALNMYCHRYLRNDNTFRSNCFIKMLMKLPDADYHPIRWARYVKKLRERLDEHPFELSYHNLDLEVIPFETLYELVIEMLEQQKGIGQ